MLVEGLDDWVYEAYVYGNLALLVADDPSDRRAISIGLIASTIWSGYMVAGNVTHAGFKQWELSSAQAVSRITESWHARPEIVVSPGEIVWLCNTDKGKEIGQAVLDREAHKN